MTALPTSTPICMMYIDRSISVAYNQNRSSMVFNIYSIVILSLWW